MTYKKEINLIIMLILLSLLVVIKAFEHTAGSKFDT